MIKRYSRLQMEKVWSDENKFNRWLEVEIAVCDAWAEIGAIPREAIPKIKLARCNMKRMDEILKETHHDMTAFLGSVAESLGEESRFIHLGLTSSDIMDTALSLQMVEAAEILIQDVLGKGEKLKASLPAVKRPIKRHRGAPADLEVAEKIEVVKKAPAKKAPAKKAATKKAAAKKTTKKKED